MLLRGRTRPRRRSWPGWWRPTTARSRIWWARWGFGVAINAGPGSWASPFEEKRPITPAVRCGDAAVPSEKPAGRSRLPAAGGAGWELSGCRALWAVCTALGSGGKWPGGAAAGADRPGPYGGDGAASPGLPARYRLPLFAAGVGLGLCTLSCCSLAGGWGQMLPSDKALPVWLPVLAVLAGGGDCWPGVVLRLRRRQKWNPEKEKRRMLCIRRIFVRWERPTSMSSQRGRAERTRRLRGSPSGSKRQGRLSGERRAGSPSAIVPEVVGIRRGDDPAAPAGLLHLGTGAGAVAGAHLHGGEIALRRDGAEDGQHAVGILVDVGRVTEAPWAATSAGASVRERAVALISSFSSSATGRSYSSRTSCRP